MFLRTPVGTPRLFKVGRTGKLGRQPPPARGTATLGPDVDTSKLSHVARRRIASPPMAKIERAVDAVGSAVQAWGDRFVDAVMRRTIPELIDRADSVNSISSLRLDASVEEVFNSLDDPKVAKATLEEAFRAVDKASSDDLRVVGVRTGSVVPNADRLQSEWIEKNTNLIKAQQDVVSRVRKVIEEAVPQGKSVDDIRKLLEEQVGYARSRAELTARDQTLKLYGQIQEERQRAAGFTQYVWTTSLDERVRKDHAVLDGAIIDWNDPPIVNTRTGQRGHPGSDFQCRCSAVPYTGDDVAQETEDLPDIQFEATLPESPRPPTPPPDLNAERERLAQERAQQEAELARLEAERAAERARLEAEAERQRVAAEQARLAAEAERARVEAERMTRLAAEAERSLVEAERAKLPARAHARKAFPQVKSVSVENNAKAKAVVQALDDAGMGKLLEGSEAVDLQIRTQPIEYGGGRVGGVHESALKGGGSLRVDLSPDMLKEFTDDRKPLGDRDLWAVASAMNTVEETVQAAAVHEFGHMVHRKDYLSDLFQKVDDAVFRAGRANPAHDQRDFISVYATTSKEEYFAEAFAAYRMRKEWLFEHAPRAFAMVEEVLKLRGLLP